MPPRRPAHDLHRTFDDISTLLEHHRSLIALASKQDRAQRGVAVQLQQRQNVVELQRSLRGLHPADLAFVLEGLEPEDRLQIWTAVEPTQAAVPLKLQRVGRDPAQGASVLLTFVTDSMGFFVFLGLAWLYL